MKTIIEKYLNINDIIFTLPAEDIFEFEAESEGGPWKCRIKICANSAVSIYAVFPIIVPASQRPDSAMYLMWLNKERVFGNFELDLYSGEIKFKTFIDCENAIFTDRILDRTLFINMATVQKYLPEFLGHLNMNKVA
jgi:hypothetical protein